jgi:Predicted RNA-binding proteins
VKLLKQDKGENYAEVKVENEDDLWHLEDLIGHGDMVSAVTQRTKLDGREKKTLKLTVEAEKAELEGDRLRVTGEMKGEYQDVEIGYHTLNITPGTEFEISSDFTKKSGNGCTTSRTGRATRWCSHSSSPGASSSSRCANPAWKRSAP